MKTNGTWYHTENGSRFQQYKTRECKNCLVRPQCTSSKRNGKIVQRRLYAESIEANKQRIKENPQMYRQRQAIVEHPYGTIKRQWGFCHILSKKGIKRASSDVGLMMLAYNLRRIINIVEIEAFREYLTSIFLSIWGKLMHFKPIMDILKIVFPEHNPESRFFKRLGMGYIYVEN